MGNLRGSAGKCCFSDGISLDAACQSLSGCAKFCHGLWEDCDASAESMDVVPDLASEEQQYCCFSDGIKHDNACQGATECANFCHGLWKPCQAGAQHAAKASAVSSNISHIDSVEPREPIRTGSNLRGSAGKCCFSDGISLDAACQSLSGCAKFCHGLWEDCDASAESMD